ncbi:MAG: transcriptional regulator NrdR [Acidimicrobiales bacterium]
MRCPACGTDDDKVVDSRAADEGAAIRRRRECLACGRRFTTFERVEEVPIVVVKRAGHRETYDAGKIIAGVRVAAKDRPVDDDQLSRLAAEVEEEIRLLGQAEVESERIGVAVLDRLRRLDSVAAVRFASVYKGFDDLADFEREVTELSKDSAPKQP